MKRREFLKLMALMAGSGVSACKPSVKPEKLISYLVPPEEGIIPGIPFHKVTTCSACPAACGVEATMDKDHPFKLEGLVSHPANFGKLCVRGQASLHDLYHPKRLKNPMLKTAQGNWVPINWEEALQKIRERLKGEGNFYLKGRVRSSLKALLETLLPSFHVTPLFGVTPIHYGALWKAYNQLLGLFSLPLPSFNGVDCLVTIGADLLDTYLNPVYFTKKIGEFLQNGGTWFHLQAGITLTGMKATHTFYINPQGLSYLLAYLHRQVLPRNPILGWVKDLPEVSLSQVSEVLEVPEEGLKHLLHTWQRATHPLFIPGGTLWQDLQEEARLAVAWQVEQGANFDYQVPWDHATIPKEKPQTLILGDLAPSGWDPSWNAWFQQASFRIGITTLPTGIYQDCHLLLPLAHPYESWGDEEPLKGLLSIHQPLLEPLGEAKSEGDILLALSQREETFQAYVMKRWGEAGEELLEKGWIWREKKPPSITPQKATLTLPALPEPSSPPLLVRQPSVRFYEGAKRENPLLQEIPDPISTISYGRYMLVNEEWAEKKGLEDGMVLEVTVEEDTVQLPIRKLPFLPENRFIIDWDLASLSSSWAKVKAWQKTGKTLTLPILAGLLESRGREILPEGEKPPQEHLDTLYPPHPHPEHFWAMAVDLDRCTGCSACAAACYVENNVPLVGEKEHLKGREMSWLRIEPHLEGKRFAFIPMMCQQCEDAPCEPVCPVFATYHNPEGLNVQVYNRCVGTRYCSNNCPYKVRRFNWFDHTPKGPLTLLTNPLVSRRPRGVMEKCTFCIQRIHLAKENAKREGRALKDGEIIPACAQTCPNDAIVFGDGNDGKSRVAQKMKDHRAYRILESLGTRPSVVYLKKERIG